MSNQFKPGVATPEDYQVEKLKRKFPTVGVSAKDMKDAMLKLGQAGMSARKAGKAFSESLRALGKTQKYSPSCVWQFRDEKCQYVGPAKICNKTVEDCTLLGNLERYGGFRPSPAPPELRPDPAMIQEGGLFYEGGSDDVADAESYKMEYQGTFATGGMVPQSDFPKNTRENFERMKEALLKDVAMKQERAFMEGGPVNIYADDEPKPGQVTNMWLDEEKVYTKAPEGIPQKEWSALSVRSQELILKRLGYSKEERKNFKDEDRAIDL